MRADVSRGGLSAVWVVFRVLAIVSFLTWAILFALASAIDTPIFHLDGAFQTASGMFRLDAGQFPGRDFYPYLGIAPLLSIYTVFKLLGAKLAASVASAAFMTLVVGWLSVSILWQLIFRSGSFASSLVGGAVVFFAPIFIESHWSVANPLRICHGAG